MGGTRLPGEAELLQVVPALNAIDPSDATKMPLEARMYGIFAGFIVTWVWVIASRRSRAVLMPPSLLLFIFVAFIAVMGFDGINATLYDMSTMGLPIPFLYEPRLDLRLASGLLSGIGIGGIMLPIVNFALWRQARAETQFARLRDLAPPLINCALIFALIVSGSALFLYPVSALGVLGVIALIGALNLVLLLSIFQRDGAALSWSETLNPLAVAVLMTALELGALSAIRYALFGTQILP
jgi:hypothetical protein